MRSGNDVAWCYAEGRYAEYDVLMSVQKLEEDIDQKRIALEVDSEALNMESGWAGNDATKR